MPHVAVSDTVYAGPTLYEEVFRLWINAPHRLFVFMKSISSHDMQALMVGGDQAEIS